ncbi:hypothetical protein AMECASPLE_001686 [Ameca splendens]|uniref:Uncharacterized protein n=1 Tax=Ameca splendens TaxID=208324 RepID=A0ABV0ZHU5_9TELE
MISGRPESSMLFSSDQRIIFHLFAVSSLWLDANFKQNFLWILFNNGVVLPHLQKDQICALCKQYVVVLAQLWISAGFFGITMSILAVYFNNALIVLACMFKWVVMS